MSIQSFLLANVPLLALLAVLVLLWLILYYVDVGGGLLILSPSEAIMWANQRKSQIIDIRSKADFTLAHVAKAKHLEFGKNKPDLTRHKKDPVLILDDNGWQSRQVARYFKRQGFREVAVVEGGIKAWRREHLPLTKD